VPALRSGILAEPTASDRAHLSYRGSSFAASHAREPEPEKEEFWTQQQPRHGAFYAGTDAVYGRPNTPAVAPVRWQPVPDVQSVQPPKRSRKESAAISVAVTGEGRQVTTTVSKSGRTRRAVSFGGEESHAGHSPKESLGSPRDAAEGGSGEKKGPWTDEEETLLARAVGGLIRANGKGSWAHVSAQFDGTRSNNSCRHRWNAMKGEPEWEAIASAAQREVEVERAANPTTPAAVWYAAWYCLVIRSQFSCSDQ
jgi:hypothetical protein